MNLIVPKGLELYEYQKQGAIFLVENKGGLIADEMGLGKTVQAIVAWNTLKAKKILVICPAVMRLTWAEESKKWSVLPYKIQVLESKNQEVDPDTDIVIVSYNYIVNRHAEKRLRHFHYDTIVTDEHHALKNWNSQRTKQCVRYWIPRATYKIGLTGTPITRCVTDLHSQLSPFLKLGGFRQFARTYSNEYYNGFSVEYRGINEQNKAQLHALCKKVMRRRLKKNVLTQLPDKVLKRVHVKIPDALAVQSMEFVDAAIAQATGEAYEGYNELSDHVATIKRKLGIAKIKATVEYALEILESKPHVVIFAYHKDVIEAVHLALEKKGKKGATIVGSTGAKLRHQYVKQFQNKELDYLVVNMVAGGVGITLTAADHAIIAELDWTPANIQQAMDRLHRISQKNVVQVDFLIGKECLDDRLMDIIMTKLKTSRNALGDYDGSLETNAGVSNG